MHKLFTLFAVVGLVVSSGLHAIPAKAAVVSLSEISSGDLIRGETFSAVYYYGEDGFRYVFPNDKTYFTWYEDFDDVKWISDADLGTVQIGGNVTYRPGAKMIKINSDPKTYAVDEHGTLRWVTSEEVAIGLYGSSWNTMIDDVPDAFFSNYEMGADIEDADEFTPSSVTSNAEDINDDKDLQSAYVITIDDNSYDETTYTVEAGRAVRFVNNGDNKHTATADDESWGTGTLTAGQSFSRYFNEEGEWDFHCNYHSDMTATIVVE